MRRDQHEHRTGGASPTLVPYKQGRCRAGGGGGGGAARGIPVGEHAMTIHTSTSHDLRTTARPIRRFGELAVNIHTSI
jgi:hypothetical protein